MKQIDKQIDKMMKDAVADRVFPGGVLLVSKEGKIIFFEAYGYANLFSKAKMTGDTIFDLASLTKPLATTPAVMKLVEYGKLDIEQTLGAVLPVFRNTEKEQISIRQLLAHNSGLPDYRPYYKELCLSDAAVRETALRNMLVKEPLAYPAGEKVLYSDLGFMILRWIIETLSGKSLDAFTEKDIYEPLGLKNLFFRKIPPAPRAGKFAATEICPWRNMLLEGTVHDENAYAAGGIEGHAGLFGTAEDICRLVSEWLAIFHGHFSSCIVQRNILKVFWERQKGTDRALGFDMPSLKKSAAGHYFSENSIGHLGFTGTSFWADTERLLIVILLTNRVHPSRENVSIRIFRPKIHDAVMKKIAVNAL
jgi:CubicO group peptidase (beta-lactamase class C family)